MPPDGFAVAVPSFPPALVRLVAVAVALNGSMAFEVEVKREKAAIRGKRYLFMVWLIGVIYQIKISWPALTKTPLKNPYRSFEQKKVFSRAC